jgi:pimeloyl-ACP methyl ester carboxylesterase
VNGSLGALRQVDAGVLDVGCVDAGPSAGPAVVLLHGSPYDIHSYVDVVPLLTTAGYRVIVPYRHGYGTTRFRSDETVRNGEQAALAEDAVALMDALEIEQAIVAGIDWRRQAAVGSPAGTPIGRSRAASATTFPRKRRRCSPMPSSRSVLRDEPLG